jgi:hypothetical protein
MTRPTTDTEYAELLVRLGIKPKPPSFDELMDEMGEAPF